MGRGVQSVVAAHGWHVIAVDLIVFGFTFGAAGALALVYSVIAGRTLSSAQFGLFNALFGVITIASHLGTSIQLAATSVATRHPDKLALRQLVVSTVRMTLPATVVISIG